jgi:acyl carrier protein
MTTESTNTTSIAMRVRTLIAQHLDHDPAHVSQASRVVADLGADSLDLAEMVLILEDAFDATISESDLLDVVTVGDVTSLVERLVAAQVTDLVPGVAAPST